MGKKKSVVLMTLLTIVIVVLCAITVFPPFAFPGKSVKEWNPAIYQYDLGKDLGGGYYTYYYPEGVISETEFKNNLNMLAEEDKQEYIDSYLPQGGLYLEKDEDLNIVTADNKVDEDFAKAVASAADEMAARFAATGYSDFKVSVVDKYSVKVELPASEANMAQAFTLFSQTGALTLEKGDELIDELKGKEAKISDLIDSCSVYTRMKVAYLRIKFTAAGKEMLKNIKSSLSLASETTDSSSATTLNLKVGGETVVSIFQDYISDANEVKAPLQYEENKAYVDLVGILLNSVLENGEYDVTFRAFASSDIRSFESIYGKDVQDAMYIALAIVIVALSVASVLKMGRFGVINVYSLLSYLIITGLCYGFITKAVFEITFGSLLVFVLGMLLITLLNTRIYGEIKNEFENGKTVVSAVKGGYNKTLGGVIDIYAVALLAALALLIATAGLQTMALQAIICVISAAFCNLLWGRAINFVFLSASKNKYKYFRFIREEDDDDE